MEAGVYAHYKGGRYLLIGVADHTESGEELVVYVSLTGAELPGSRLRARPLRMWNEFVPWPDGMMRPRFIHEKDKITPRRSPSVI